MAARSDALYVLSSRISLRVLADGRIEIASLEPARSGDKLFLPAELHAALLRFSRPCAIERGDRRFLEAGLLSPVPRRRASPEHPSIASVLNPKIFAGRTSRRRIAAALKAGRLCVIQNAFKPRFAARVHRALSAVESWQLGERLQRPYLGYRFHNLTDPDLFTPDLERCRAIWDSASTKDFLADLFGLEVSGPVDFAFTHYFAGDFSTPHTDVSATRSLAYVWNLTRGWRRNWGGYLFWCASGHFLEPAYNNLILFRPSDASHHLVTNVTPAAKGKRLAVTGWWTRPDPKPVTTPHRTLPGVAFGTEPEGVGQGVWLF